MVEKCVTWKQPDGDHFNGWCTNRFRLTNPPEDVRTSTGCSICVNPVSLTPPTDCAGCSDFVDQGGPWPLSYTVRGSISAPADTAGIYTATATNATGTTTRTAYVYDYNWSELESLFNGGRLIDVSQIPGMSRCSWRHRIVELTTWRQGSAANYVACGVFRNRPDTVDTITQLDRVEGAAEVTAYLSGQLPWPEWPSGYGSLSGTTIASLDYGATTQEQIYPDCPGVGVYGGNVQFKVLNMSFGVVGSVAIFSVQVESLRLENFTYLDGTTGIWARTFSEIAPYDIPADPAPDPPYGVAYEGTVDCFRKNYFRLQKNLLSGIPDPLNVYPDEIEIIGGAA